MLHLVYRGVAKDHVASVACRSATFASRRVARECHNEKLKVDREAAARKQKLEKYYNRSARSLKPLNVGDPMCVQNAVTKQWD